MESDRFAGSAGIIACQRATSTLTFVRALALMQAGMPALPAMTLL